MNDPKAFERFMQELEASVNQSPFDDDEVDDEIGDTAPRAPRPDKGQGGRAPEHPTSSTNAEVFADFFNQVL